MNNVIINIASDTESDLTRFCHTTQNGEQFQTGIFISGILYSIFLDCSCLCVTRIAKQKTSVTEGLYTVKETVSYLSRS